MPKAFLLVWLALWLVKKPLSKIQIFILMLSEAQKRFCYCPQSCSHFSKWGQQIWVLLFVISFEKVSPAAHTARETAMDADCLLDQHTLIQKNTSMYSLRLQRCAPIPLKEQDVLPAFCTASKFPPEGHRLHPLQHGTTFFILASDHTALYTAISHLRTGAKSLFLNNKADLQMKITLNILRGLREQSQIVQSSLEVRISSHHLCVTVL